MTVVRTGLYSVLSRLGLGSDDSFDEPSHMLVNGACLRPEREIAVPSRFHDMKVGEYIGSAERLMHTDGIRQEKIPCSGNQDGGRKTGREIGEEGRNKRIA